MTISLKSSKLNKLKSFNAKDLWHAHSWLQVSVYTIIFTGIGLMMSSEAYALASITNAEMKAAVATMDEPMKITFPRVIMVVGGLIGVAGSMFMRSPAPLGYCAGAIVGFKVFQGMVDGSFSLLI